MLSMQHFFILLQKNQINERSPTIAEGQLENKMASRKNSVKGFHRLTTPLSRQRKYTL